MKTTILTGLSIFAVLLTFIIARYNYHAIKHKETGDKNNQSWWHKLQWLAWVLFYGCISFFAVVTIYLSNYLAFNPIKSMPNKYWYIFAALVAFLGLVQYNLFDGLLNRFRGLKWTHRGKNPMDRIFGKWWVKLIMFVIVLIILILIF